MDNLPKDVQQIIYKFVWKKSIKPCHEELENRKISIIRKVIEYNKGSNGMCAKKWAFGLEDILRGCYIIDYSKYIADMFIFDATSGFDYTFKEDIEVSKWLENIMGIFENISNTNKWIELPHPPYYYYK